MPVSHSFLLLPLSSFHHLRHQRAANLTQGDNLSLQQWLDSIIFSYLSKFLYSPLQQAVSDIFSLYADAPSTRLFIEEAGGLRNATPRLLVVLSKQFFYISPLPNSSRRRLSASAALAHRKRVREDIRARTRGRIFIIYALCWQLNRRLCSNIPGA